jgi:hypothetical protein
MSNSGNALYRKRSEFTPRIARQRRILIIAGAIAILIVLGYLAH